MLKLDGLGPGNEARYKGTLIEFNVKTGELDGSIGCQHCTIKDVRLI